MRARLLLGAIADDLTGATDLCNTLVAGGMRTVQVIGVPRAETAVPDADAVVVALKSRTVPPAKAVRDSRAALAWLREGGARQIFFKYCSTFDSTPRGNIGPVADALLDDLGVDLTIACPAFPTNGRTVYKGHLFVGDVLLENSGMRNHPLTPMRDSNLVAVLGAQTPRPVGLVGHETVRKGDRAIRRALDGLREAGTRHAVVDAIADKRLDGDRRGLCRSAIGHRRLRCRHGLAGEFPEERVARGGRGGRRTCRPHRATRR